MSARYLSCHMSETKVTEEEASQVRKDILAAKALVDANRPSDWRPFSTAESETTLMRKAAESVQAGLGI